MAPTVTEAIGVADSTDRRSLKGFGTALISDCLDRVGAMDSRIARVSGARLAGPAFPVRTMAGDSRVLHHALMKVPAGSVLVVAAEAHRERAVWGEIMTVMAQAAGVVGLVVDGAVRDIEAVRRRAFPVFACGVSPAGPHKAGVGSIGATVSCGGVVVSAGDLVLGDADGVVVIPKAREQEVFEAARARRELERSWISRIEKGESSVDVLGSVLNSG
jgi:4-hydroxy-4-methyl-2-oxoglutarate aldolase